jgi:response regulator RpfG family c-di-GMP phosphodiesterase
MTDFPANVPETVLLVDDDPDVLFILAETLRTSGLSVRTCASGVEACEALESHPFGVLVADQNMPGMKGMEVMEKAAAIRPLCSRILLSGMLLPDVLLRAINGPGIFRFVAKPWKKEAFVAVVWEAFRCSQEQNARAQELEELKAGKQALEEELVRLTRQKGELDEAHDALRVNFEHSLGLCFRLISTFYPLLGRQAQGVVEICRAMAASEYFTEAERHALMTSAWIYDIGLVALDRGLLHRLLIHPQECSEQERTLLRYHPIIGQTLAAFVDQLQEVGITIRAHHERFDGTGYPDGLAGQSIPWTARCLAVAVAFVQSGLPRERAVEFIQTESGSGFDPEAVRLFLRSTRISDLPENVKEVLMAELQPGMRLARGIVAPSGVLLLPEGQVLTELAISKLGNHGDLHLVTERLLIYAEVSPQGVAQGLL